MLGAIRLGSPFERTDTLALNRRPSTPISQGLYRRLRESSARRMTEAAATEPPSRWRNGTGSVRSSQIEMQARMNATAVTGFMATNPGIPLFRRGLSSHQPTRTIVASSRTARLAEAAMARLNSWRRATAGAATGPIRGCWSSHWNCSILVAMRVAFPPERLPNATVDIISSEACRADQAYPEPVPCNHTASCKSDARLQSLAARL